jgi:hypothetical protein
MDLPPLEKQKCKHVPFEAFTAVIMKNVVFWDVKQDLHSATSQKTIFFKSINMFSN